MRREYVDPSKEEALNPYQELVLAEEHYRNIFKQYGNSIPRDEASQDEYLASIREAQAILEMAQQKVAAYEEENVDEMERM